MALYGVLCLVERRQQTDAFTLLFSFFPSFLPLPHHLHSMLDDQVSPCPSGERERERRRRWVALINGRKLDDGMERRETDRPHNPPYQDIAITSLSFSLCISPSLLLLCVIQTHQRTQTVQHSPDTTCKHTADRKQAAKKNIRPHLNSRKPTSRAHTCRHTHTVHKSSEASPSGLKNAHLPAPYGRATNNREHLNIFSSWLYANLRHIAFSLQGATHSHT